MAGTTDSNALDYGMMTQAIAEARRCEPKPTAFCVGCVLVVRSKDGTPIVLARGYSRELEGNTHAEANALTKARGLSKDQLHNLFQVSTAVETDICIDDILREADVYTTMEPCSVRTSQLAPCADALIAARIRRCIIGVGEPDDFVQCEGAKKLVDAGVQVVWLKDLERECLEVARMGRRPDK
ncbi:hypothetical protein M0805_008983 [Coniferiporia weirii]|nr:hypothetical protein M0805_008983 [Coniferiporia weirii]